MSWARAPPARCTRAGTTLVAIKTLKLGANQKTRSNFVRESALMTNLLHPNIVYLIGVCMQVTMCKQLLNMCNNLFSKNTEKYCEAQARVRQGSARDGSKGERSQSLNPSLELTLKLVATTHPPTRTFNFT